MTIAQYLNTGVSAAVAAASAVFCITYHRLAPWRSTPMGWHLMTLAGAIGALGLYTVVITLVGLDGTPATVLRIVRAGLLLLVAALLIQRTLMVIRAQKKRPPRA
ncbi:putative phage holin [Streptomyces sp. CH6]|uniref:putative phage holin n=1 Tax=Streptomyces sp. CH6 TaxID=3420320 RepID=UPI003D02B7DA